MAKSTTISHLLVLILMCSVVFGFKAGDRAFWGKHGEARRAEVSREMVASGNWLVPHLNGDSFATKPPLYYWAAALTFTISGTFDELSARLPSIICGTLGVLVTYFWGRMAFSPRVGLFAGVILATSFLYGGMARMAGIDMMLTLFTTAALGSFTAGIVMSPRFNPLKQANRKLATRWYLLTAVWIGLATLTKNPIGLAVPVLAMVGFILVTREIRLILDLKPWWGLLIVLLIVLPWFLAVHQRVPDFVDVLHQETLGRYTDPDGTPHLQPFYYYIPALGAFAPWVIFLPGVAAAFVVRKTPRPLSKPYLFLGVAAVITFGLFSSVGSKREYYLLPLYPVLALLVAHLWDTYLSRPSDRFRTIVWKLVEFPYLGFAGALCVLGAGLPIAAQLYLPSYLAAGLGFGVVLIILGIVLLRFFWQQRPRLMFAGCCAAAIGMYLFALTTIVPEMDVYRSRKAFFQEVAVIIGDAPLVDYHYRGFDAQFYLQRTIPLYNDISELEALANSQTPPTFVLTTGRRYEQIQQTSAALNEYFEVVLNRVWTSAVDPERQKRLVLLRTGEQPPKKDNARLDFDKKLDLFGHCRHAAFHV